MTRGGVRYETKHDQHGCADARPKKEIIRNATAQALAGANINGDGGGIQRNQERKRVMGMMGMERKNT